jgi:hypothetical protein
VLVGLPVLVGLRVRVSPTIGVLVGLPVLVGLRVRVSPTTAVPVGRAVLVGFRVRVSPTIGVLVGRGVLVGFRVSIPCAPAIAAVNKIAATAPAYLPTLSLNMPCPPCPKPCSLERRALTHNGDRVVPTTRKTDTRCPSYTP